MKLYRRYRDVVETHSRSLIQSLQGTLYVAKDSKRLQADIENSDKPARIRVFAGHTCNLIGNAVS